MILTVTVKKISNHQHGEAIIYNFHGNSFKTGMKYVTGSLYVGMVPHNAVGHWIPLRGKVCSFIVGPYHNWWNDISH